jgi:fumarate hydratase class II
MIRALAQVKRASATVNHALGLLDAAQGARPSWPRPTR